MFKHHGPGLLAVALGATFVLAGHGQATLGFEDVAAVRIVALHAIHPSFDNRMMLRQMKLAFNVQVTLETGSRILPGIDDESGLAAGLDVFAAGAVAGFATRSARQGVPARISARMWTGREGGDNGGMAVHARLVPHQMGAGNGEGDNDRPVRRA